MLVAPYHPHFSTFPPDANLLSPSSPLQQYYSLDTGLAASSSPSFDHIPSQSPHSRATPSSHHTTFDSTPAFDLAASTSTRTSPETLTRYMSDPLYFQNPAIGIQQSTPVPQQSQGRGWSGFEPSHGPLAAGAYPPQNYARRHSHQRGVPAPSIASPASATAASSFYRSASFSMAPADHSPALSNKFDSYPSADQARMFSNNLPTPTQTPTQDSFGPRPSSHYNNTAPRQTLGPTMTATMAMKQECDQNALGDDELPGLNHSARHSVSSFGNSPSTPHTAPPEETGEGAFKMPAIDTVRAGVFSASPATVMASPARSQRSQGYLSPFPSGNPQLAELLQEANKNRSGSPNVSTRPISPFRQDSPYFEVPPHGVGSAAQMRQRRQHMEAQAMMARQAAPSRPDESQPPKTVSPKDVELDYDPHDDDSRMPLFPDGGEYSQPPDYGDNQYHPATHAPFGNVVSASPQSSFSFSSPAATALNGLSLPAQQYRPTGNLFGHESVPDFPAHLSSMESSASASEAAAEPAQSSAHSIAEDVPRPSSTLADTGTYSCTYHGCTQRFDSPQKLQSHKREGHRQHPPGQQSPSSQAIGSNMSSSALLARNSQAGPHKCERVNPTTGKPCNTIFSRPYDLTRHEDTIHNGRKQKVRCALCVEEKTFSRNDALTRHMRVVHPEVDFPGKHRRRGGATA